MLTSEPWPISKYRFFLYSFPCKLLYANFFQGDMDGKKKQLSKPVIVCLASQKVFRLENSLPALFLPPADIWLASSPLCSCLSCVLAAAVLVLLPLSPPVSVALSVIVQCRAELTKCLVNLTPVLPFSNPPPAHPQWHSPVSWWLNFKAKWVVMLLLYCYATNCMCGATCKSSFIKLVILILPGTVLKKKTFLLFFTFPPSIWTTEVSRPTTVSKRHCNWPGLQCRDDHFLRVPYGLHSSRRVIPHMPAWSQQKLELPHTSLRRWPACCLT